MSNLLPKLGTFVWIWRKMGKTRYKIWQILNIIESLGKIKIFRINTSIWTEIGFQIINFFHLTEMWKFSNVFLFKQKKAFLLRIFCSRYAHYWLLKMPTTRWSINLTRTLVTMDQRIIKLWFQWIFIMSLILIL